MPHTPKRYASNKTLLQSIRLFQAREIIPHCRFCRRPCCNLTDVVLEFDWHHLRTLYHVDLNQKAFDRSLQNGSGPSYIRKQAGSYYTHGSPCPGYDTLSHRCRHYHSWLKPVNCTDFPLYLDNKTVVADQRCEAMNKDHLLKHLQNALPSHRFRLRTHPDFPVLINIDCIG